jgi:hypothetical protein
MDPDLDSINPDPVDPAFEVNPDPDKEPDRDADPDPIQIQGLMRKTKEKFLSFQPSKDNIEHYEK